MDFPAEWGGSTTYGAKHGKTVQDLGTDGPQWHSGWDMVTRWEDVRVSTTQF